MVNLHSRMAPCLFTAGRLVAMVEGVCSGSLHVDAHILGGKDQGAQRAGRVCVWAGCFFQISLNFSIFLN